MKKVQYQIADQLRQVKFEQMGDQFRIQIGDHEYHVKARQTGEHRFWLEIDGRRQELYIALSGDRCHVWLDGQTWTIQRLPESGKATGAKFSSAHTDASGRITATMPGLVRNILVKEGDTIERGAPVILLEAMKMELRLTAPHAGQVRQVHCTPGQVVERGQLLVEISEVVDSETVGQ